MLRVARASWGGTAVRSSTAVAACQARMACQSPTATTFLPSSSLDIVCLLSCHQVLYDGSRVRSMTTLAKHV